MRRFRFSPVLVPLLFLLRGAPAVAEFTPVPPFPSVAESTPVPPFPAVAESPPVPPFPAVAESPAASPSSAPVESLAVIEELRDRCRQDHTDLESRRALAALLEGCPTIEGRREAAEALTEALLVDEADPDLWMRLARVRHAQRFLGESRRAYRRALELAPDRGDLWEELAVQEVQRFQRFDSVDYLRDAFQANQRALVLAPDRPQTWRRQVRISYFSGDLSGVDSLITRWRRVAPEDPWPRLAAGMRLVETEEWARAAREFRTGFARLDSLTLGEFGSIAMIDPLADLEAAESPDSAGHVADYWRWNDPTPADELNPRLLEHYRRMVLAELLFSIEDRDLRGWRHAPGQLLVRYGVPTDWTYAAGVNAGEPVRVSSSVNYSPPALLVRYGAPEQDLTFRFIDFAMNGVYVRPPSSTSSADLFLVGQPSLYDPPFPDPDRDQDVEVLRFLDRSGNGRIELVVALPPESWPGRVLRSPERLMSRIALYDSVWEAREKNRLDWADFARDPEGRLVATWSFPGTPDSVVVGLETLDLDGEGRSAFYAPIPPREMPPAKGPVLSDIAFLREVDFDPDPGSPYLRESGDGAAIPNPGHRYFPDESVGIAFEGYELALDDAGDHRARVRIAISRRSGRGLFQVLLGIDGRPPENELVFESAAPGSRLDQLLTLRVPGLRPGSYLLSVEIEDLRAGLTTRGSASFEVQDGSPWSGE